MHGSSARVMINIYIVFIYTILLLMSACWCHVYWRARQGNISNNQICSCPRCTVTPRVFYFITLVTAGSRKYMQVDYSSELHKYEQKTFDYFWSELLRNVLKRMKIYFSIFIFWVLIGFFHNFQVNQTKYEKKWSQKMRNVLKRVFVYLIFFVRFLVFEIWSILYSKS